MVIVKEENIQESFGSSFGVLVDAVIQKKNNDK